MARVPMWQARMGYIQRLRRFTSSHAACNRRCRAAQNFTLGGKINQLHPFGDRRLEYIRVDHKFDYTSLIIELCYKTQTIRKIEVLLDYHRFPFRSTTEIDIGFEFWRSNALGFSTRISWYSEKATMNFRDWRGYQGAFEPVESKSGVVMLQLARTGIRENSVFHIIAGFPDIAATVY